MLQKVMGLGSNLVRLEELAEKLQDKNGDFQYFIANLAEEQDIVNAINWAKKNIGPVHVLINNAGIDVSAALTNGKTKDWKRIFDINVIGLSVATREAVQNMVENQIEGHIIHVNALPDHELTPLFQSRNMYVPVKHAVTALADSLRLELRATNSKIKVTTLRPGFVENQIKINGGEIPKLRSKDVTDAIEYILSRPSHVQIDDLTISAV